MVWRSSGASVAVNRGAFVGMGIPCAAGSVRVLIGTGRRKMQYGKVVEAGNAVQRFLVCMRALNATIPEKDKRVENHSWIPGSKESGALRRASLDLTRALAEMRKP